VVVSVKLTIERLGRIARAELNVRPLTVFIGPNNTQKSWTAYSLYTIVNSLSARVARPRRRTRGKMAQPPVEPPPELDARINSLSDAIASGLVDAIERNGDGQAKAPRHTTSFVVERDAIVEQLQGPFVFRLTPTGMSRALAVQEEEVESARVSLEIPAGVFKGSGRIRAVTFEGVSSPPTLAVVLHGPDDLETRHDTRLIESVTQRNELVRSIVFYRLRQVAAAIFSEAIPFPAERKTLVAFYRRLNRLTGRFARRASVEEDIGLGSLPISAFIGLLENLERIATESGSGGGANAYADLADSLERDILRGTVNLREAGPFSELSFTPAGVDQGISMNASSSLVRALSGLDLYLQQLALPNSFLVFDEPEMNAHPEAQVAITELIAVLVNAGFHITLTTHSPYIVDHLNNLVEGFKVPAEKRKAIRDKLKLKRDDAFLDPTKVSVYHFSEGGAVRSIYDSTSQSLDWSTFSNQSDYLSDVYNSILQAEGQ
jgi:hypothetical protein